MPTEQEIQKRNTASESISRIQNFDVQLLPRVDELGTAVNFTGAVALAKRLVDLYGLLSLTILEDLPERQLDSLISQANNDYAILRQVLEFQPGSPVSERDRIINTIDQAYQGAFDRIYPFVAFSAAKSTDFKGLERQARATIQAVKDEGEKLKGDLEKTSREGDGILETVRKIAAEHGVTQQAIYFKDEAVIHETASGKWQKWVYIFSGALGVYAVVSLFLHKIDWLKPVSPYEMAQLAISKLLIFIVLSYLVYLATKNYLAHKHNAVVNKHRQNALLTYEALVKAAKESQNKDVILTYAAACIFGPQCTGYSKEGGQDGPAVQSVVGMLTKAMAGESK